jgi:hypothetical protein
VTGTKSRAETSSDLVVEGSAIVYRLHDVGYAIDLDRTSALLAASAPERALPARGEAEAIQIKNPPVLVTLGSAPVMIGTVVRTIDISARVFDFGVCALRATVEVPQGISWDAFAALGAAADTSAELALLLDGELARLLELLGPAIERPGLAPVTEAYVVYRVRRLTHADGTDASPHVLTDEHLVSLLLNERDELSAEARRELLPHRFSYYLNELSVLTWDNALVIEPRPQDHDVEYILEFANAQLLELRFYDAMLDRELPRMYDRVAVARNARNIPTRRFSPLLGAMQTQVADITETVERVDNALKVTDDVHLARIYAAALELFRADAWRRGIDRKLAIMRETYAMLNDESQAARAEILEMAIVLLIVFEIVWGFVA